jgi:hypothetical protein
MTVQKIPTSDAKVGMILAEPITDQQGRIIMTEGSRLTPVHVKRLDRWGVSELVIQLEEEGEEGGEAKPDNEAIAAAAQIDQEYMRELASVFNERFEAVADQPLMQHLKKVAFKAVVLNGRNGLPGIR